MTTAAALGSSGVISLTLGSRTEEDGCEMESSFCAAVMIALEPEGIRPPRPFTRSRPPSSGSVNSASDRRTLSASSITSFGIFLTLRPHPRPYAAMNVRIS